MSKNFYVTTPIYYVNDKPHIGHAYTTILADVLNRFYQINGYDTFFLTGLDEHGQKVQEAAKKKNIEPLEQCDEMVPQFKNLWEKLHISNNDFIRTTEPRHVSVVQDILTKVFNKEDIYKDEYEGLYSVSEERFITEKEAETGNFRDIKKIKEKNYFFRMSKYQNKLIKYIESNPNFIQPEHRKNEIIGFLDKPLNDLCISRPKSRLSWGIELPFDKEYVTYVWFDALINYLTGIGFKKDKKLFEKYWPASYQLIGKDILTTHAIYWPTMLMSLGIELPKTIFAHGWWLISESKMSKSIGNVIDPMELINEHGADPVRYYLMREMVLGQDSNFTVESFKNRYNSDLANDFGNLLSRVSTLMKKNFEGKIPLPNKMTKMEKEIQLKSKNLIENVRGKVKNMRINEAIEDIMQFIRGINKYVEVSAPWKMVKVDKENAGTVLFTAGEALRISALLLEPIMPNRTSELLAAFDAKGTSLNWGGLVPGTILKDHDPLFPRLK